MKGSRIRCGLVSVVVIGLCGICRLAAGGTVFTFDQDSYAALPGETVTIRIESAWAVDLSSAGLRLRGIDSNYFDLLSVTASPKFDSLALTVDDTNDASAPGVDGPAALFPVPEVFSTGDQIVEFELEAGTDVGEMFLEIIDWDTLSDNTVESLSGNVVDDQYEAADYYERVTASVTPEPGGAALLLVALSGLLVVRRRKEGEGIRNR